MQGNGRAVLRSQQKLISQRPLINTSCSTPFIIGGLAAILAVPEVKARPRLSVRQEKGETDDDSWS